MARGILMGAIAGLGKGMAEVGKSQMDQQESLDRMSYQKDLQLQLEQDRMGLVEALRQKKMAATSSAAESRLSGMGEVDANTRSRVYAEEGFKQDGEFGKLYDVGAKERDFKRLEKNDDRNFKISQAQSAQAAAADGRAAEQHKLTMTEAKTKQQYLDAYRKAVLNKDAETASTYANLLGLSKQEQNRFESRVIDGGAAVLDKQTGTLTYYDSENLRGQNRAAPGKPKQDAPPITSFFKK